MKLRNNLWAMFLLTLIGVFLFAEGAVLWAKAYDTGNYLLLCFLTPIVSVGAGVLVWVIIAGGHNER